MNIKEHKKIMSYVIFIIGLINLFIGIFYAIFFSFIEGLLLILFAFIFFCLAEIIFYLSFIAESINNFLNKLNEPKNN